MPRVFSQEDGQLEKPTIISTGLATKEDIKNNIYCTINR